MGAPYIYDISHLRVNITYYLCMSISNSALYKPATYNERLWI